MKAIYYEKAGSFKLATVPVPEVKPREVLIKVSCCGLCGSDLHLHGETNIVTNPFVPGHEVIGSAVTGFSKGDRVVADPLVECGHCFFCLRAEFVLCENLSGHGVSIPGGFSQYVTFEARKVFKIHNISDEEATLIEPTACAIRGIDKLDVRLGVEALVIGAGPAGLVLAQLLKLYGATKVVVAANKGTKTELARKLAAADESVRRAGSGGPTAAVGEAEEGPSIWLRCGGGGDRISHRRERRHQLRAATRRRFALGVQRLRPERSGPVVSCQDIHRRDKDRWLVLSAELLPAGSGLPRRQGIGDGRV